MLSEIQKNNRTNIGQKRFQVQGKRRSFEEAYVDEKLRLLTKQRKLWYKLLKRQKLFQIREERIVLEEDVRGCTATDKTMRSTK